MNYRTERLPAITFAIIILNTIIWILTDFVFGDLDSQNWISEHLWLVPSCCTWYAPLTSMFVHAGFSHWLGNMMFLFLFGSCVEDLIGRVRFTVFYLLCGLAGVMGHIALTPEHFHSCNPSGGASGAISGCMAMYLLLRANANMEFKYFIWFFSEVRAGNFEIPAWVAIAFWFGRDLILGLIAFFAGHNAFGVAFGAHVGGFLCGLALLGAYRHFVQAREQTVAAPAPLIDPAAIIQSAPRRVVLPSAKETPAIYLHDGRQQTGPFTLTAVQAMLHRGEISRDASYWSEGMDDWQPVVDLAGQPAD